MENNYINHIGLVLDRSGSMNSVRNEVVTVADMQVQYLAQRSRELDQETRMTVYTFDTEVECVYYDKDVLRLPSLKGKYQLGGMTALIDATLKAINDLKKTATLYGDHAFLLYVLTDGAENASTRHSSDELKRTLMSLPDNWTVAVMVPNQNGVFEAKRFGFSPNNIAVWDTTPQGMQEVGRVIRESTDNFMVGRSKGIRSTKGLFELDVDNLRPEVVKSALTFAPKGSYTTLVVQHSEPISAFVERETGRPYRIGSAFYELTKTEEIQAQKQLCVRDSFGNLYKGPEARQILGLPNYSLKVRPSDYSDYDVFVQSTSVNRKLVAGTTVIVF